MSIDIAGIAVHASIAVLAGLAGFAIGKYVNQANNNQRKTVQNQSTKTLKYLLIGTTGVGKTKIFQKFHNFLNQNNKQDQVIQDFQECPLRQDIDLVDTPSIDFESSVDKRESIIQKFVQYMVPNYINHFFLVVNYERTDLMKKKILDVLKYFKKFKESITIIVSNFQLSENQEKDKVHLKESLKYLLNSKQSILFVQNDFDEQELKQQLLIEAGAFSLDDTIFEPQNEAEFQELYQKFGEMFNKRDEKNQSQIKQQQNENCQQQNKKIELTNKVSDQNQQNNEDVYNSSKLDEIDLEQFQNSHSTSSQE
ncbi:unnamed protein product [Paramecium sonneborni]|uniref:G domain-containing protein n=1 Tax=Paramecium sonneborni TaxID=65129 RepID=A0A8S1RBR1_9CILI|nr:unnamed protein product [Paramecium sonneborni]